MSIVRQPFGKTPRGEEVELFTLRPRTGNLLAKVITYGAHVTELHTPDRDGNPGNIVLGFDNGIVCLRTRPNQPARRKYDLCCCSFALFAVQLQAAAMLFHHHFDNRKTQTCPIMAST
jgi:hypothetical protein